MAAGYDGEFGVIKLFDEQEKELFTTQLDLFDSPKKEKKEPEKEVLPQLDSSASINIFSEIAGIITHVIIYNILSINLLK